MLGPDARLRAAFLPETLEKEIASLSLDSEVKVIPHRVLRVLPVWSQRDGLPRGCFTAVHQEDVAELVEEHLTKGRVLERLLYREPETQSAVVDFEDIPFFKKQTRIVLENCGIIDPIPSKST